jgi:riboflavin kinase
VPSHHCSIADTIEGTVPLHPPLRIAGTVVKGFGRGSKELGIPTANVDAGDLRTTLAEAVTGIFAGWASVNGQVYKTACSIGWNPVFGCVQGSAGQASNTRKWRLAP